MKPPGRVRFGTALQLQGRVSPHGVFGPRELRCGMLGRKNMKRICGSANRTGFHHFVSSILPVRQATKTEIGLDVLGGVVVVGLIAGMAVLMHLVLAN